MKSRGQKSEVTSSLGRSQKQFSFLLFTVYCLLSTVYCPGYATTQHRRIKTKGEEMEMRRKGLLLFDSTKSTSRIDKSISDSLAHYLAKGRTAPLSQGDKKKAIALSILLPGLGDQYIGNKTTAIRFYVVEGCIWSGFFGMRWYANILKNDCILYAVSSAGAYKGMDEDYYDAVEWHKSIDAYNEYIREEARAKYWNDRDKQLAYIEEHSLPDSLAWDWKNSSDWNKYRNLRQQKRDLLHKAGYCIGAAIMNRVVSAILVSQKQERYGILFEPNGIKLYFTFK